VLAWKGLQRHATSCIRLVAWVGRHMSNPAPQDCWSVLPTQGAAGLKSRSREPFLQLQGILSSFTTFSQFFWLHHRDMKYAANVALCCRLLLLFRCPSRLSAQLSPPPRQRQQQSKQQQQLMHASLSSLQRLPGDTSAGQLQAHVSLSMRAMPAPSAPADSGALSPTVDSSSGGCSVRGGGQA
jgi:hypothetical protein